MKAFHARWHAFLGGRPTEMLEQRAAEAERRLGGLLAEVGPGSVVTEPETA